jgi:hypothetical protein
MRNLRVVERPGPRISLTGTWAHLVDPSDQPADQVPTPCMIDLRRNFILPVKLGAIIRQRARREKVYYGQE